jgi:hypothetical protein
LVKCSRGLPIYAVSNRAKARFQHHELAAANVHDTTNMPHATPDSTADDSSRTMSQDDIVKPEPETQDVTMDDASSPPATAAAAAAAEKPKVNLEDLFDDEDSDEEFPSSAPGVKSEEDLSLPGSLYMSFQLSGDMAIY